MIPLNGEDFFDRLLISDLSLMTPEEQETSYERLPVGFLDFSLDVSSWPELNRPLSIGYDRISSLADVENFASISLPTIAECSKLFLLYSDLLKDSVEDFSPKEIAKLISPLLSNVPLPFSIALSLQLLGRVDWSTISEVWHYPANENSELLELRRMIVDSAGTTTLYSSLPLFRETPFLNRTENDEDGGIGLFFEGLVGKDLSMDELDFVVSTGGWLFGDIWGEFHSSLQQIFDRHRGMLYRFSDTSYRLFIRRSLYHGNELEYGFTVLANLWTLQETKSPKGFGL